MKRITKFRRSLAFGLGAVAMIAMSTLSSQHAQALTPVSAGAVSTAKYASDGLTTEVRGGHGHGGGHFHGGGFHAGRAFHGGHRFGGYRFGGYRHHFYGRHFYHRHHFYGRYYGPRYYYGYPHRHCRIVWTYYGPRRICHFRPWWHHRYYW